MHESEEAGANPPAKLTVKRDVDVSGRQLATPEPVLLGRRPTPPAPRPRPRILGPLFLLALFALTLKVGYDFRRYLDDSRQALQTLQYGQTLSAFLDRAFAPLTDEQVKDPAAELRSFLSQCQARLHQAKPDSELAGLAVHLGNRLLAAASTRVNYLASYQASRHTEVASFRPDSKEDRARRQELFSEHLALQPWQAYVDRERPVCADQLQVLTAREAKFTSPRGTLQQVKPFLAGYVPWIKRWLPAAWQEMLVEKPVSAPCPTCHGLGWQPCPSCRGSGKATQTTSTPCEQCKGSGLYQRKLAPSAVKCPFCNGQGQKSDAKTVACATCQGSGRQVCATCAGRGMASQKK